MRSGVYQGLASSCGVVVSVRWFEVGRAFEVRRVGALGCSPFNPSWLSRGSCAFGEWLWGCWSSCGWWSWVWVRVGEVLGFGEGSLGCVGLVALGVGLSSWGRCLLWGLVGVGCARRFGVGLWVVAARCCGVCGCSLRGADGWWQLPVRVALPKRKVVLDEHLQFAA